MGSPRRQWVSQYEYSDSRFNYASLSSPPLHPSAFGPNPRQDDSNCKINKACYKLSTKRLVLYATLGLVTVNLIRTGGNSPSSYLWQGMLRRILLCAKSSYISPDEAVHDMPPHPKAPRVPSHVTLCRELIRRNDFATQYHENKDSDKSESEVEDGLRPEDVFRTKFVLPETFEVCTDWSAPHYNLLQMISSSVVAHVGARFGIEYEHDCHRTVGFLDGSFASGDLPFDVTTIQQVFPQLPMPVDENKMHLGEVVYDLCQSCLDEHDSHFQLIDNDADTVEGAIDVDGDENNDGLNFPPSAKRSHHCLLFPEHHQDQLEVEVEEGEEDGSAPSAGALEAVLPLVKNRLNHAALDWADRSGIPSHDKTSGVVIYIDPENSYAIPLSIFKQNLPSEISHITILSSPKCPSQKLTLAANTDDDVGCLMYSLELKEYLQQQYEEVNVSFDLVSSTAASFSRMILSKYLVCLPNSIACLLPALSKDASQHALLLETAFGNNQAATAYRWIARLSQENDPSTRNVQIIPLSSDSISFQDDAEKEIVAKYKMDYDRAEYVSPGNDQNYKVDYGSFFQYAAPVDGGDVLSSINAEFQRVSSMDSTSTGVEEDESEGDEKIFNLDEGFIPIDSGGELDFGDMKDVGGNEVNFDSDASNSFEIQSSGSEVEFGGGGGGGEAEGESSGGGGKQFVLAREGGQEMQFGAADPDAEFQRYAGSENDGEEKGDEGMDGYAMQKAMEAPSSSQQQQETNMDISQENIDLSQSTKKTSDVDSLFGWRRTKEVDAKEKQAPKQKS